MEDLLRPLYQERASQEGTLGVLLFEKNKPLSPSTDNFDVILFIVVESSTPSWTVKHYQFSDKKAALHVVDRSQLNQWLIYGTNRRVIEWIVEGTVLFDRNEFLENLKDRIDRFPIEERLKKIGLEFSKLIRRISDGKELFSGGNYLDAFNDIVHALHHLARLSVIENGYYPEITVWNQVKAIEPEIYQLYKELISGDEPIEKRIELLLIANDFSILSKTKIGSKHFLSVLEEKELWTFAELSNEPELEGYKVDLGALLEFLIDHELVKSIQLETKSKGLYHRVYSKI